MEISSLRAETGTARSVRLTRATAGWKRAAGIFSPPAMSMVFTLPHQLAPLALQNKREIYGLLFRTSAENRQPLHHPHVHCVVPAGGLA